MEDSEIQYLGHVGPLSSDVLVHPPVSGRCLPTYPLAHPASRIIGPAGIVLSVVDGDEERSCLQFFKSQTNKVIIGRASSSPRKSAAEGNSAFFRCPVISRSHAEIEFNNGNVCLFPCRCSPLSAPWRTTSDPTMRSSDSGARRREGACNVHRSKLEHFGLIFQNTLQAASLLPSRKCYGLEHASGGCHP
jgi:hypothetical protein